MKKEIKVIEMKKDVDVIQPTFKGTKLILNPKEAKQIEDAMFAKHQAASNYATSLFWVIKNNKLVVSWKMKRVEAVQFINWQIESLKTEEKKVKMGKVETINKEKKVSEKKVDKKKVETKSKEKKVETKKEEKKMVLSKLNIAPEYASIKSVKTIEKTINIIVESIVDIKAKMVTFENKDVEIINKKTKVYQAENQFEIVYKNENSMIQHINTKLIFPVENLDSIELVLYLVNSISEVWKSRESVQGMHIKVRRAIDFANDYFIVENTVKKKSITRLDKPEKKVDKKEVKKNSVSQKIVDNFGFQESKPPSIIAKAIEKGSTRKQIINKLIKIMPEDKIDAKIKGIIKKLEKSGHKIKKTISGTKVIYKFKK